MPNRGLTKKIKLAVDGDSDSGLARRWGIMTDSPAAHPYSTAEPVNETPCNRHKLWDRPLSLSIRLPVLSPSPESSFTTVSIKGSLKSPCGELKAEFFERERPLPLPRRAGDAIHFCLPFYEQPTLFRSWTASTNCFPRDHFFLPFHYNQSFLSFPSFRSFNHTYDCIYCSK